MAGYKPKVISLTKRPGQTFGFYLRVEHGEDGHLIRSLEMGGPAELAGMKDGDRIIRVNGAFVDSLSHSEVSMMWNCCSAIKSLTLMVLFCDLASLTLFRYLNAFPWDRWWTW